MTLGSINTSLRHSVLLFPSLFLSTMCLLQILTGSRRTNLLLVAWVLLCCVCACLTPVVLRMAYKLFRSVLSLDEILVVVDSLSVICFLVVMSLSSQFVPFSYR
jgi:hypothetical protein